MHISQVIPNHWRLRADTAGDQEFLDALDLHRHARLLGMERKPNTSGPGFHNAGATVELDGYSPAALAAKADRQLRSALTNSLGILLRQLANHVHAGALPANPQPQEPLPAGFVQLQLVLESLGLQIVKKQLPVNEVVGAHGEVSGVVGDSILAQGAAQC